VVGINVRNRDLQSVVTDIQKIVTTEIKLTDYVNMEDNLKNLQSAKSQVDDCRATALFLIFILLYILLLVPSKKP
jgi:cobalt-zinc-cadmium resistance protein CzcA